MEPAGIEPATPGCKPDALPAELWPRPWKCRRRDAESPGASRRSRSPSAASARTRAGRPRASPRGSPASPRARPRRRCRPRLGGSPSPRGSGSLGSILLGSARALRGPAPDRRAPPAPGRARRRVAARQKKSSSSRPRRRRARGLDADLGLFGSDAGGSARRGESRLGDLLGDQVLVGRGWGLGRANSSSTSYIWVGWSAITWRSSVECGRGRNRLVFGRLRLLGLLGDGCSSGSSAFCGGSWMSATPAAGSRRTGGGSWLTASSAGWPADASSPRSGWAMNSVGASAAASRQPRRRAARAGRTPGPRAVSARSRRRRAGA